MSKDTLLVGAHAYFAALELGFSLFIKSRATIIVAELNIGRIVTDENSGIVW